MIACGHRLCELVADGSCRLAAGRSRGCRPGLFSPIVAADVFDEVRALLAVIDAHDKRARVAAIRLAEIIRREAREDRHLVAMARDDEPELAPVLSRLCTRQR